VGKIRFQNRRLSLIRQGLYLLCLILASIPSSGQSLSEDWLKAEYTLLLSSYVSWENEALIDTFQIGVFGSEEIYTQLSFKSESMGFKDKPFNVIYFRRRDEIKLVQILYIGEEKNNSLRKLRIRWKETPVLFVTDSCKAAENTMINLLGMNLGGKPFKINKSNIEDAGLSISSKILAVGGSEDDLRSIYNASKRELENLKSDIEVLNVDLLQKKKELEKSMEALHMRMEEIDALNEEISKQTEDLDVLTDDIELKQKDLTEKLVLLRVQEGRAGNPGKERKDGRTTKGYP